MNKIVWMAWFQGRDQAPELVQRCISSWEEKNPTWVVKCLDATTLQYYVDLSDYVDLNSQQLTTASLSDIARLALLHEYGGVWADATTLCNVALDDWLTDVVQEGFFAFDLHPFPQGDRPLSSWFLAAEVGNGLLAKWAARTKDYWQDRSSTDDYFWLHHLFYELLETDACAARDWFRVPKLSADGPHAVQVAARSAIAPEEAIDSIDWATPVFKLTYRVEPEHLEAGTLLDYVLERCAPTRGAAATSSPSPEQPIASARKGASLCVSTQNRGDHVQIIAAHMLMRRIGIECDYLLDRDHDIASASALPEDVSNVPILMNGWHKTNREEWPPNAKLNPVFIGFHIRLWQCPELLSDPAIDYYKAHAPIGCRDVYTHDLLQAKGVDSFVSQCLSLLFPRRLASPSTQTEVFVVSRDERVLASVPAHLGPVTFVNHYAETGDFDVNLASTIALLEQYRSRARLIVTTLLHCALPAIAMGIPVVMIYPHNTDKGHKSDLERLSSLARLVRIYNFETLDEIDWRGHRADVSVRKLKIIERFVELSKKWNPAPNPVGPIAPRQILPGPSQSQWAQRRAAAQEPLDSIASNTTKWGNKESYKPQWAERAQIAAAMIPSEVSVLELGAGAGDFEKMVAGRTRYTGTDLAPVADHVLKLNLDQDDLPSESYDYTVFLGVFEYLMQPRRAADKLCEVTSNIVAAYCCRNEAMAKAEVVSVRRGRGWATDFTKQEFVALFEARGFCVINAVKYQSTPDFEQTVFHFRRLPDC